MTKVRIKINPVILTPERERISPLTKYGSNDIVVVANDGILHIEYYDSKEKVSMNIESVPKLIDSLMFVHSMETRLNKEEMSAAKKENAVS
jgi:hypothetical protein